LKIVAALKGLTEPTKEERNPLTDFVEFLKTKRIIDDRGQLQDKSRPFTTLATRGFSEGDIALWRLMEVSKKDKKTNAVQTFLTLHSGYFRSVGYDESAIYKGKREADIRKKYTEFATDLLKKEYDIEADDKDFWKKIADDFDMNFTIYKMVDGRGVADQSLDTRPGVAMYNIYQTSDGFYYPIAMTDQEFHAAAPIATGNPELGLRLRQQPFGGAIDGVQMNVGPSVQEEKATKSTAAAASRQQLLDSASQKWAATKTATHANLGVPLYTNVAVPLHTNVAVPLHANLGVPVYNAATAVGTGVTTAASSGWAAAKRAVTNLLPLPAAAAAAAAPAPVAVEPDPDNPFGQRGGGRRRTNNAWLRSKPVRYTRRKFYK
jgi:hypothetical protein